MLARNATLVIALALISQAALAQSQTQPDADTFVIEGTRLNQTASEAGTSITVITADEIEAMGFDYLIDVLATAPGVTINQNSAFGGTASVRIRGAASEQTLVLVDGVVVNDPTSPGGGFNFARFDTNSIERIEILRGPQSTLWGTDAIGGVISIITKRSESGFGGSAFLEAGSFSTFRGGASASGANDAGEFRLGVVGTTTDGISKADEEYGNPEEDNYENLSLSASGALRIGANSRLIASAQWTDAMAEFDSYSGLAQGNVADGDEVSETEEFSGNVALHVPLFEGRLDNTIQLGLTDIQRENFTNGTQSFFSEGDRMSARYLGSLQLNERNRLVLGAEREQSNSNGQDVWINGYLAIYEARPIDALTVTGGLRMDDHKIFGSETTGRIALAYNPNRNITWRASWGQGFKAPTIFQTTFFCCGAIAPNADLQAETSEAFDAGIDWSSTDGRAQFSGTVFHQETEQMINFSFGVGGYVNIAEVETNGFEASGSYQLTDWLALSVNYALIDSTDTNGNQVVRVPEHSGDVVLSLNPTGPWSATGLLRYNGEERNIDGTTLNAWTRVDLTAHYELANGVEIYGHIENLFDESYQQILGYGTPGISGFIGIRADF